MCSLVMSLWSRDVITITLNGNRLTGLICSKAPDFWMVEHQLVLNKNIVCLQSKISCGTMKVSFLKSFMVVI